MRKREKGKVSLCEKGEGRPEKDLWMRKYIKESAENPYKKKRNGKAQKVDVDQCEEMMPGDGRTFANTEGAYSVRETLFEKKEGEGSGRHKV